ncbi:MAG: phenylacetate--CoA ligase [Lachnospiraceae bacterium]|nr:phenylacetate--CoA ligase [Lachnospiraceae bacterium]
MDERFWKITEHAYTTVPLYIRRDKSFEELEEWEDIPVLEKTEILNNPDSFYSGMFFGGESKEIIQRHTSGTTGKYLELYWNKNDYRKSLIPVWIFRKKYYNIRPSDKMCYFYTTSNMGCRDNTEYEEEYRNVKGFSKNNLNHQRMLEIYAEIIKYNPVWLFIQPSMASLLCDAAEETGMGIDALKYVEFTGEMLTKDVRKRVEDIFGCKTANHYGCNEVNTIAFECPYGKMHVISNDIYVEAVDTKNGKNVDTGYEGGLLITSSVNRVNPFLRYNTGDKGKVFDDVKCMCGCNGQIIELTGGRVHDFIKLKDGTRINAYIFVHAVEEVNREYESCIRQFQIIQNDYDRFNVRLSIDEEVSDLGITKQMIEDKFTTNVLHPDIGDAVYEFEFYSQLFPEGKGGKWCWFIRNVDVGR